MNRATKRLYGASCGAWSCGKCAPVKRRQVIRRLRLGLEEQGRSRFLTLTMPPGEPFDVSARRATRRFETLRLTYFRTTGSRLQYLGVAERGSRGQHRLHLHLVVRGGPYVRQADWSAWAERSGFGRVVDIRQVRSGGVGAYAAKALGGYLTKAASDTAWPRHFHRVRVSQRWAPSWIPYRPATSGEWAYIGMEPTFDASAFVARLAAEARAAERSEGCPARAGGDSDG